MRATDVLLDYCAGKRDDLSLVVERDGVRMQMFTDETEVAHMVDVQALFLLMISVRNGLAIASMLCLVAAFALRLPLADAMKKLMWGLGIGLLIPILCGVLAVVDFNWFWTQFHHVFFTNDLWLLNPATSVLIQMVPEAFFSAIVTKNLDLVCCGDDHLVCFGGPGPFCGQAPGKKKGADRCSDCWPLNPPAMKRRPA